MAAFAICRRAIVKRTFFTLSCGDLAGASGKPAPNSCGIAKATVFAPRNAGNCAPSVNACSSGNILPTRPCLCYTCAAFCA